MDYNMNKEEALKNLKDLDRIFRETETEYWLSCGTLLGFYRDGDFIGHDTDTDVCVSIECLNKSLLDKIADQGFNILRMHGRVDNGFEITLIKNNIKTDLFFFYKNKDNWFHSVYANHSAGSYDKFDYEFKPFTLKEKEYLGHTFFVPQNEEEVIIQQYGKDWRVPNKNWSYFNSPKNIVNTGIRVNTADCETDFKNIR